MALSGMSWHDIVSWETFDDFTLFVHDHARRPVAPTTLLWPIFRFGTLR